MSRFHFLPPTEYTETTCTLEEQASSTHTVCSRHLVPSPSASVTTTFMLCLPVFLLVLLHMHVFLNGMLFSLACFRFLINGIQLFTILRIAGVCFAFWLDILFLRVTYAVAPRHSFHHLREPLANEPRAAQRRTCPDHTALNATNCEGPHVHRHARLYACTCECI